RPSAASPQGWRAGRGRACTPRRTRSSADRASTGEAPRRARAAPPAPTRTAAAGSPRSARRRALCLGRPRPRSTRARPFGDGVAEARVAVAGQVFAVGRQIPAAADRAAPARDGAGDQQAQLHARFGGAGARVAAHDLAPLEAVLGGAHDTGANSGAVWWTMKKACTRSVAASRRRSRATTASGSGHRMYQANSQVLVTEIASSVHPAAETQSYPRQVR